MSRLFSVVVLGGLAVDVACGSAALARQKVRHDGSRAVKVSHYVPRAAFVDSQEDPACLGGYLAQTQAQDYLRDDIWVLQPVPDGVNRPYRFHCHRYTRLR
jgi:hypothetical protein